MAAEYLTERDYRYSVPNTVMWWSTAILLVYFGARLVYLALNLSSYVPPDEVTHAGLCRVFANALPFPENTPDTYRFGLVTNIPWLYYGIMGQLLHLNVTGTPDLLFLRLLNIPLAFGTVWYTLRILQLLTDDRLTRLFLLAVVTNIPMFSLLASSISYDNLTNLLAAMSIYYLLAFFMDRKGNLLAASILCQLLGCLTKTTMLPLVLMLAILLLLNERQNLRRLPALLTQYLRSGRVSSWLLTATGGVALGLTIYLYAGNYLSYGVLAPTMTNVLTSKVAMENRIGARETIFSLYEQGRISYQDALQMAGGIKHIGDKSDTFYLLMNYENLRRNPLLWMGFISYTRVWFEQVTSGIFGIKSHLQMIKKPSWLIPVYVMMALALLGGAFRWRPQQSGWLPACLAVIAFGYAGFILYKINYQAYRYYGTPGITLQGRYHFVVLAPCAVLFCRYLTELFAPPLCRLTLAAVAALMFIVYDFPWFLLHATKEWYL